MTDRVRELILDEVDRVPSRPGDLTAVRERARQRHRHRLVTLAVVAVTLVAGALAAGVGLPQGPRAPFIGMEANETAFLLHWCPEDLCGVPPVSAEAAVDRLGAEPWVQSVELRTEEEVWDRMVERHGHAAMEEVSPDALAPIAEVVVERERPILDIAVELGDAAPGAGVSIGRLHSSDAESEPLRAEQRFDPDAAIGPRQEVAVEGARTLHAWRVRDGGVCFELSGMVSCHRNELMPGTDVSAHDGGGWGSLDDGSSCTWGRTGLESQEVVVTFDDGPEVQAQLGLAPDVVLAQVYLACSTNGSHPVRIEATAPGSSSSAASDDGTSIVERRDE